MLLTIYPYNQKVRTKTTDVKSILEQFFNLPVSLLGSGRLAIFLSLKLSGLSRRDHVLIPEFLSQCVLSIINQTGFPVKTFDKNTKAVLLFHELGYPQKIDEVLKEAKERNLIVIEDCAHSFDSKYKNQNVGTFGDFSAFSFSKIFPTGMGGCLLSRNSELQDQIKKLSQNSEKKINKLFGSWCNHISLNSYRGFLRPRITEICYSQYQNFFSLPKKSSNLFPQSLTELKSIIKKRKDNYTLLKNNISEDFLIPDHDPDITPNPLALPVFLPEKYLISIKKSLLAKNISADILHFDVNRNIFNPFYKKCLILPCHQYVKEEDIENIVNSIKKI